MIASFSRCRFVRVLSADDGYDRCLQCLGRHAEAAFVDDSCVCCGRMSMISLRSRLSFMKGLAPSAATRADLSGSSRGSPADALGDLRVTVRTSPPGTPPRTSYSSRSEHPVRFPGDFAGLSHGAPSISFGAPSVDRMLIAASGDGFTSSEDEGAVGLPPLGVVATAAPDPELTAMLARAAVSIGLEVNRPPSPEPSRLDDWFLGAGPRCLSSRRCMRSRRVRGWPLSRPEAARPPSPSSLPSTAEWPGGTRAFPRWRERSRCTCAHETPPLGGTVRVSRPRPVSWQPLSWPKLTVLRARQPPPCTPWLSCRFTKPRHSNRCTRVVPTRGWCKSCARRLTSLYERRKSRRGPSGRRCPPWWSRSAISGSTWQRWRTSTRHAFSTPPFPREGCSATPSRASPSSSQRYSSRPRRSSTSCPGVMHHPPLPPGPGLSLPFAVGALLRPPELLRPRPNRHIGRCVEPLAGERRPPRPSQAPSRPASLRSGPDAGNPEMLEFALSQETARTAPLLPPVEGREENLLFCFCSAAGPRASGTHLLKEWAISFSSGFSGPWDDSVRRPASSLSLTTHFASSQESTVWGQHSSPHTSGQSRSGPREFGEDASERTAFCAIHPYSLSLHHHRYVDCAVGAACTASGGMAHAAQPVSLAHAHNSTRLRDSVRQATSQVQRRSRVFS